MKPLSTSLGSLLANLEQRAQQTLDLTARVRIALADEEKDHVVSASYRNDELILVADSAAWATRIRYRQEALRAHLQAEGETQFTKIRVRVGRKGSGHGPGQ